jgi:uncharacterized protein YdhG (YjbR/CyaY superfamily)
VIVTGIGAKKSEAGMAGERAEADAVANASSVDEYIAGFPPETRRLLGELRALIRATEPEVTERISYRMPTFDLRGRVLIYIAGYAGHVGMYPIIGAVADTLGEELQPYRRGKGTAHFALDAPLPADLVSRIVEVRAAEIRAGKPGRRR